MTIDVPSVLFRVSRLWSDGMDEDEIYDITHGWWRIGPKRERARYAFAVAKGHVRAVFEIHDWRPRLFEDDGVTLSDNPRWGFDGAPATDLEHLVGLDVSALFPQGAANPVRYLNIDEDDDDENVQRTEAMFATTDVPDLATLSTRMQAAEQCYQALSGEPLLAASLGSKELFHSNLIGWLMERSPDVARDALAPWLVKQHDQQVDRVRREHKQLDLIIEATGFAPVVIENKVFSLPDEDQLDRYRVHNIADAGVGGATMLLLSLTDPGWPNGSRAGWTWVRYTELAARLASAVESSGRYDAFTVELVQRWRRMVDVLSDVTEQVAPRNLDQAYLLDVDLIEALRRLRLHDAMQKSRNFGIRRLIADRYAAAGLHYNFLEAGFARATPLLSTFLDLPDGSRIGWQLHQSQWRRFVVTPPASHGRSKESAARRVDYVRTVHPTWFDFTSESQVGAFQPAAAAANYRHFAPDFVYDYISAPGITVRQVLDLAEISLRAALAVRDTMSAEGT
jgi:hypothetical protein